MITEDEKKIIEFYREQYHFEYERSKYYDSIIQYPTTLLVVFIGGVVYSVNRFFPNGFPNCLDAFDWVFLLLLLLFTFTVLLTVFFLYSVFHGFTRRYGYLPFTNLLSEHEKKLFKHHYKYSEKKSKYEKYNDAKGYACVDFGNLLKQYYVNLAYENQKINDDRAIYYSRTRTMLFFNIILFILIAIIGFSK
jgi:hypothetical protein